jgi:hypothetical protein
VTAKSNQNQPHKSGPDTAALAEEIIETVLAHQGQDDPRRVVVELIETWSTSRLAAALTEGREQGARHTRDQIRDYLATRGIEEPLPLTMGERRAFERAWDARVSASANERPTQ